LEIVLENFIKTSEQATDRTTDGNSSGDKETPSSARERFALAACLWPQLVSFGLS